MKLPLHTAVTHERQKSGFRIVLGFHFSKIPLSFSRLLSSMPVKRKIC